MVWDLRYPILPGAPEVYIEGSFRGHQAQPGEYTLQLSFGGESLMAKASLLPNPMLPVTAQDYAEYHSFMSKAEAAYSEMTNMTNKLYRAQKHLAEVIGKLDSGSQKELHAQAVALQERMKNWDSIMVQRLSKAYDDVENYVNGFTAEYITAFNHADSSIPKVNKGTVELIGRLDQRWMKYRSDAQNILRNDLPALNKALYEAGIGAIGTN